MKSEIQTEQPTLSEETNPEQPKSQAASSEITYKSVLAVVVIGIIAISVVWFFVIRQGEVPSNKALVAVPDTEVHDETDEKDAQVALIADEIGSIDRRLLSITGQVERGFEAQQTSSSNLKHQLSDMSQDIQAIKVAIAVRE